jgi:TM2 domain-containing membrane protein YozV
MKVFLLLFLWALVVIKVYAQQIRFECVLLQNDSVCEIDNTLRSTVSVTAVDTMTVSHSNKGSEYRSAVRPLLAATPFHTGTDNHSIPVLSGYRIKSPLLAGAFSVFIPGFGQIYDGEICKGITFMVATYGMGACAIFSFVNRSVSTGIFNTSAAIGFYLWNIMNAATSATRLNHRNSLVNISLGNSTFGLTPTLSSLHASNGQEMSHSINAGLKLSYCVNK